MSEKKTTKRKQREAEEAKRQCVTWENQGPVLRADLLLACGVQAAGEAVLWIERALASWVRAKVGLFLRRRRPSAKQIRCNPNPRGRVGNRAAV